MLVGALGRPPDAYGVVSLTGNCLATPPWWKTWRVGGRETFERSTVFEEYVSPYDTKWRYFL
jgi:hypothetical protein